MELLIENIGDVTVVVLLADELDANNAKWFKSQIFPIVGKNRKLVLDMSHVRFVDSSGCGVLLSVLRVSGSANGDVKLAGVQQPVHALFELVRLHRIVEMYESREIAVRSFTN